MTCSTHWNCQWGIPFLENPQDSVRRGVPFSGVTLVSWHSSATKPLQGDRKGFIKGFLTNNHQQPPTRAGPWPPTFAMLLSAEVIDLKGFKWSDAQFSAVGVSWRDRDVTEREWAVLTGIYVHSLSNWCRLRFIFTQDRTCTVCNYIMSF